MPHIVRAPLLPCVCALVLSTLLALLWIVAAPGDTVHDASASSPPLQRDAAAQGDVAVATLPAPLRSALRAAAAPGAYDVAVADASGGRLRARNAQQGLALEFSRDGVEVRPVGGVTWSWAMRLRALGARAVRETVLRPNGDGDRVELEHELESGARLVEWYTNGADGIEHGFTLPGSVRRPPQAPDQEQGELRLEFAVRSQLEAHGRDGAVVYADGGGNVLRYGDLAVFDAHGRTVPSRFERHGTGLAIVIDTGDVADADFPLTVDPLLTRVGERQKLTAGADAATEQLFGQVVAIRGRTVAVGAPHYDGDQPRQGAVFVFEDTSAAADWSTFTTQKLTAGSGLPLGHARARFGASLALSGDTLVVGEPGHGEDFAGRAYVFERSGGSWSKRAELVDPSPTTLGGFGHAVAIDAAQDTIVVGQLASFDSSFERPGEVQSGPGTGFAWGMNEEIVGGRSDLYADGLGRVQRVTAAPSSPAEHGRSVLGVWSNAVRQTPGASVPTNNHVIAQRRLLDDRGVAGRWRYELAFFVPVSTDPAFKGQTGPEWSVQSTRLVGGVPRTHTVGLQWIANPDADTESHKWYLWSEDPGTPGAAKWRNDLLPELNTSLHLVQPGAWYFVGMEVDYSTNRYRSVEIRGPGIDQLVDLSAQVIVPENKGFSDALWISVEAQNQFTAPVNGQMRHWQVAYDRVRLYGATSRAHVFERPAGGWSGTLAPQAELVASDAGDFSRFGESTAISGDTVVVGAGGMDAGAGAAYVFDMPTGGWSGAIGQTQKLGGTGAARDRFGTVVAIDGDTVVVGEPGADGAAPADPLADSGAVWVFTRDIGSFGSAQKLTVHVGQAGDEVGGAVAVSGNTIVAGAATVDGSRGVAYLFRRDGNGTWAQGTRFTTAERRDDDAFGSAVAICGGRIAVGAPLAMSGPLADGGAVWLHDVRAVLPEQIFWPTDPIANGAFASGMAIDGGTLVVSQTGTGISAPRSVYVFQRVAGSWVQRAKLRGSDTVDDDLFGAAAVSGRTVVVGAQWHDGACPGDPSCNSGVVYVFRDTSAAGDWSIWTELRRIMASDSARGLALGRGVAIEGDTIFAGSGGNRGYVFRDTSVAGDWGSWSETILTSGETGSSDAFASRAAISGDVIAVTAQLQADSGVAGAGAVYVFDRAAPSWPQPLQKLTAADPTANASFGRSLALQGDTLVIGAFRATHSGVAAAGTAYVFVRGAGGAWTQQAKLTASDAEADDFLGGSVALDGELILAGAWNDDDAWPETNWVDSGAAYVFRRPSGGWTSTTEDLKLTASTAHGDEFFGIASALTGSTAIVGAYAANHPLPHSGTAFAYELPFAVTQPGSDVIAVPVDATTGTTPITLTFAQVQESGTATVTSSAEGPATPTGFQLGEPATYWNITTTAVVSGAIDVCVDYSGVAFADESALELLHWESGAWVAVTTSRDPAQDRICGRVTSLSPFVVLQPTAPDTLLDAVHADLAALIAGATSDRLRRDLQDVLGEAESAAAALASHPPHERAALHELWKAAHELAKTVDKGLLPAATGDGLGERLALAARTLVVRAIEHAIAADVPAARIATAQQRLADGDAQRASAAWAAAIKDYERAWL